MAIAFDVASYSGTGEANNPSWSHTCTGSDLALLVAVFVRGISASPPSSVTYNGVSLSKVAEQTDQNDLDGNTTWWVLNAPDSGEHTVSVTANLASCIAVSYTGVDQSTPTGGNGNNFGSSGTENASLTTASDNSWAIGATTTNGANPTVNGLTERAERQFIAPGIYLAVGDKSVPTAGATSVDWTSSSVLWQVVGIELKEAGGGGAVLPYRALLGVGT